ncbi:DUF3060 domain-containing protein [Jiangella alkaliphila]|uniref:DUF3060 domain-containing protein n=1 Tax=Jiangella alkaliphila TaxID=419479 RepID=A0A1H2LXA8_9ACTN|nr:DUF3060 domain-containing protein [Jiangella alkaliphila]SDU85617.1 Protein of unknown function [Jiangella alkaliphila]
MSGLTTASRSTPVKLSTSLAALALAGLCAVLVAGCGADSGSAADDAPAAPAEDTSGAPDVTGDPTPSEDVPADPPADPPPDTAAPDDPATCPAGTWRLSTLEPAGPAGDLVFSGGGSLTAELTADNRWTVEDDGSLPFQVTLDVGGTQATGTATVVGTAEGRYLGQGEAYEFVVDDSSGSVRLSASGFDESRPMQDVVAAIVPTGQTTLTCSGTSLTIAGETGVWTFTAVGEAGEPDPGTVQAAPGVFEEDGVTGTFDCAGQDIAINGAGAAIDLVGECGTVSVNGDDADVSVQSAASIVVNGAGCRVVYQGDPDVVVNGTGSTAERG